MTAQTVLLYSKDQTLPSFPRSLSAHDYYKLGNTYNQAGRVKEALQSYRRALELMPAFPEALCNLAITLGNCGELWEALEYFQRCLALKPDLATARRGLEFIYQALKADNLTH